MARFERPELGAFLTFVAVLVLSVAFVVPPLAWETPTAPETLACIGTGVFILELWVLRLLPRRYLGIERLLYALFLASMPFVYVLAAARAGVSGEVMLEGLGVPLFVGWAVYGYLRSCRALALGIVVHGIGWDLWHHAGASSIASWYPGLCLLIDLTFGAFVYTQARVQDAPEVSPRPVG